MPGEVSTRLDPRFHVVAYDFGIKQNILRKLVDEGCSVTVVPASTSAKQVMELSPDGVFLSNGPGDPEPVTTGHAEGLITINIAEADSVVREQTRLAMNESYRTLLGHFRHESGHYYWMWLIESSQWLEPFRQLFGDEREDYQQALERHYSQGPPANMYPFVLSAETIEKLEFIHQVIQYLRQKLAK